MKLKSMYLSIIMQINMQIKVQSIFQINIFCLGMAIGI